MSTVEEDVCTILQASAETGLHLNTAKCEIIMEDFTAIALSSPLADFVRVEKSEMMLLGAPVTKGKTHDKAITDKIEQLSRAIDRLSLHHAHDALVILKNNLAMPKLLYTIRTSDCSENPLLMRFDDTLRTGLSRILNVDLSNRQWLQASLLVENDGLEVRSAMMLAPSAFLASAASTLQLQQSILPEGIKELTDQPVVSVENSWTSLSGTSVPTSEARHIQKAWDRPVAVNHIDQLISRTSSEVDKARLLAATATHSGD